jgi:hypothetical protein
MEQQIIVVETIADKLKSYKVNEETAISLTNAFSPFNEKIEPLVKKAYEIEVYGAGEIDKMEAAKELRLVIRSYRIALEKKRVEIKEDVKTRGQAIDSLSRLIRINAEQAEDHLLQQEKFVELLQEKAQAEMKAKRLLELAKYEIEESTIAAYQLDKLPEAAYQNILKGHKVGHDERITAEKKVEDDRIESERLQVLYYKRKDQLGPYSQFVIWGKLFPETTEVDFKRMLASASEAKTQYEAEQQEILKENERLEIANKKEQAKLKAVQDKLVKQREKELQAKRESMEKIKKEIDEKERIAKEKAAIERAKQLAPDKEKLKRYTLDLASVPVPELKDQKAKDILIEASTKFDAYISYINQKILTL